VFNDNIFVLRVRPACSYDMTTPIT